jgi:hypothetical protein
VWNTLAVCARLSALARAFARMRSAYCTQPRVALVTGVSGSEDEKKLLESGHSFMEIDSRYASFKVVRKEEGSRHRQSLSLSLSRARALSLALALALYLSPSSLPPSLPPSLLPPSLPPFPALSHSTSLSLYSLSLSLSLSLSHSLALSLSLSLSLFPPAVQLHALPPRAAAPVLTCRPGRRGGRRQLPRGHVRRNAALHNGGPARQRFRLQGVHGRADQDSGKGARRQNSASPWLWRHLLALRLRRYARGNRSLLRPL